MPWIDCNGSKLFYREAGSSDAEPLVLIHEMGGMSLSWQESVPALAAEFRVISVDLRGAGLSEKLTGPVELEDLADDIAYLIGALGYRSANLAGAAAGAVIAATLAMRHSQKVGRMVLANVAHTIAEASRAALRERAAVVRQGGMCGICDAALAAAFPAGMEALRASYAPIFLSNDPASYAETVLAISRMHLDESALEALSSPLCVISAACDAIWPPEFGRRLADLVPGSVFHVIDNAAHFPHIQQPDAFAYLTLSFLRGNGSSGDAQMAGQSLRAQE